MPKFSIIIPVFNAEEYLEQCIQSVISQSVKDFELILVDDCSQDGSLEICRSYCDKDERIVLVSQNVNSGVSAARNRGLDIARGDYVMFIDSDDFVTEDYLETIDREVNKPHGELLLFGKYDYLVSINKPVVIKEEKVKSEFCKNWTDVFDKTFFASPCNKVFLREIIEIHKLRFDISCVCYEDYLFNIEYCIHVTDFTVIDKALYYYRQIAEVNHISKRKWGERFAISKKVYSATDKFICEKGTAKELGNLHRYTYGAFVTELKAAKDEGKLNSALDTLVRMPEFSEAVRYIKPKGKKLTALSFCMRLGLCGAAKRIMRGIA